MQPNPNTEQPIDDFSQGIKNEFDTSMSQANYSNSVPTPLAQPQPVQQPYAQQMPEQSFVQSQPMQQQFQPAMEPQAPLAQQDFQAGGGMQTTFNQPQQPQITQTPQTNAMPDFVVPAPVAPPKKSRKWLVLGIIVGTLVTLLVAAWAVFAFVYSKPEKALLDGVTQLITADDVQAKTTIDTDYEYDLGTEKLVIDKLTYDTNASKSSNYDYNMQLTYSFAGEDRTVGAAAFFADTGDIYFKLSSITATLKTVYEQVYGTEMSSELATQLSEIDDKWTKITVADMNKWSEDSGDTYKCVIDAVKKGLNDEAVVKQMTNTYKSNQFLQIDGTVKSDGMLKGYDVTVDTEKAKEFGKAFKDTDFAKQIESCDKSASQSEESDISSDVDSAVSDTDTSIKTTIWVHQFTHKISRIDAEVKAKDAFTNNDTTTTSRTDIAYDSTKQLSAPTGAMTVDDFAEKLQGLSTELEPSDNPYATTSTTSQAVTNAMMIMKKAEAYYVIQSEYPANIADFEKVEEAKIADLDINVIATLPTDEGSIGYKRCSSSSAQVVYWDAVNKKNIAYALGIDDVKSGEVTSFC